MARPRRRPLGALFVLLAAGFAAVTALAAAGGAWPIAVPSGLLALWMGELALRVFR